MKTEQKHLKEIQNEFDCYNPVSLDTEPVVIRLAKLHHKLDVQEAYITGLKDALKFQAATSDRHNEMFTTIAKHLGIRYE